MKILKLETVNFMGLKGRFEFTPAHITALCGKNGIGKTTLLNAVRFGLTGAEPEGDVINASSDEMKVSITLNDTVGGEDVEFTRYKHRTKPSKCMINGKATTMKSMNDKIESVIGIDLDKIKVLSSSEVVAAMKPQEFAAFILDYIPEKIKLSQILDHMPDASMGMVEILSANLPEEDIEMSDIDEFAEIIKANRKDVKAQLASKKLLLSEKPTEEPEKKREDVERELKELDNIEAQAEIYRVKKAAYDKAVESANKQKELIASLESEAEAIKCERPNPVEVENAKKSVADLEVSIRNQQTAINGVNSALTQLRITREALEKPICPISPLITCHQDKTVAKEEIQESIESSEAGLVSLNEELEKTTRSYEVAKEAVANLNALSVKYEKYISLRKQIKTLEDSKVEIPAMPEAPDTADVSERKETLKRALKGIEEYEEGLRLAEQIKVLEENVSDLERLVKAFADKGPVRIGIIQSYLGVFTDICNERSAHCRPEIQFDFRSEDGVKVYMSNDKGEFLAYENLSGGEKAYMLFIIIDMLNSLCGTRLLFLDELSVLDTGCFDSLLGIIQAYSADYDHIFVAAVDHPDTVASFADKEIPIFTPVAVA